MFPKEMDARIDDEDVGFLDALLDVPDFDVDSLFAAHVETEQEVQRHSRLIDDAVAEAQVEPADVRQFELSSTVRFRTGSSDKVYEKSIGSRFDKVSDDDIEKIIAEQKNRNTKDATDKWLIRSQATASELNSLEKTTVMKGTFNKCKIENHFHVTVVKK